MLPRSLLAAAEGSRSKPNILFILADDLGWSEVGYEGAKLYPTPNINRLADMGMVFTDAYAACPVCSPTRASIITGKYPARLQMTSHVVANGTAEFQMLNGVKSRNWLPLEEHSIAESLSRQGYATALVGKWHLGNDEAYWPKEQGFDEQIGVCDRGLPPTYHAPYTKGGKSIPDIGADAQPGEYLTDRLTDEACSFMRTNKDKPFLCYLSHYAVHTPYEPRKDLAKRGDFPAMMASLDASVGKLLDTLKADGLDRNTVVVFMSDNGGYFGNNTPLRDRKGSVYEGGIRTPMIIHWPGVTKPGSTCNVPVISTDFFPTMEEMAGGDPAITTGVDGANLVPLLKGGKSLPREALYWHYPHIPPFKTDAHNAGAVRKGNYKLIERFGTGKVELYNLEQDIGEKNDLADTMPKIKDELLADLRAWRKSVDAAPPPRKAAGMK